MGQRGRGRACGELLLRVPRFCLRVHPLPHKLRWMASGAESRFRVEPGHYLITASLSTVIGPCSRKGEAGAGLRIRNRFFFGTHVHKIPRIQFLLLPVIAGLYTCSDAFRGIKIGFIPPPTERCEGETMQVIAVCWGLRIAQYNAYC